MSGAAEPSLYYFTATLAVLLAGFSKASAAGGIGLLAVPLMAISTSTLAHAGGPPLLQYLLPLRIGKLTLVATTVYFFAVVNYVKLVPYGWLGLLDAANLSASLLLAPVVPVGYWIGHRFTRMIPERAFLVFIDVSLLATGAKLLWDAVSPGFG